VGTLLASRLFLSSIPNCHIYAITLGHISGTPTIRLTVVRTTFTRFGTLFGGKVCPAWRFSVIVGGQFELIRVLRGNDILVICSDAKECQKDNYKSVEIVRLSIVVLLLKLKWELLIPSHEKSGIPFKPISSVVFWKLRQPLSAILDSAIRSWRLHN